VNWMCKLFERGRRRRCAVKEKKEPSLLSFKGGREGAVSQTSPLMRRFETPVTLCTMHDLHAALSRRPRSRHASAASASSHGPLTTRIDACGWIYICMLALFYQLPNCNLFTQHVVIYLMERHH
jgi:hypothetical protein